MKTEGWHKCQSLVQTVPVSVSRNAKLDWIGYTNRGTLCSMDSKCKVSCNFFFVFIYEFLKKKLAKFIDLYAMSGYIQSFN